MEDSYVKTIYRSGGEGDEGVNKRGCPACNSTNIQFSREKTGENRYKGTVSIKHETVGFCKDCGYTWYPNIPKESGGKSHPILWLVGILFFLLLLSRCTA